MRTAVFALSILLFTALASHFIVLFGFPGYVMSKAFERLEARGLPVHQFVLTEKISPQNQTIVRASPDLAYSICRFDLSDGPIRISGARWEGYASLSIFDADTNNVLATSLDLASGEPNEITLIRVGEDRPEVSEGSLIVELEQPFGLALIRRLAPSQELYDQAAQLSAQDRCAPL